MHNFEEMVMGRRMDTQAWILMIMSKNGGPTN